MRTFAAWLLVAVASLSARADEALDRLGRVIDEMGRKDGYQMPANWGVTVEKLEKPIAGSVTTTVDQRAGFMKLLASFEDGDLTVLRKGDKIASLDPTTDKWGSIADDSRAKFVTKMFDLKEFLTQAKAMAKDARLSSEEEGDTRFIVIEFGAEQGPLEQMLNDSAAGEAIISSKLESPTMKVRLTVHPQTGMIHRLRIEVDAIAQNAKPPAKKEEPTEFEEWPGEDEGEKKPADPKAEPAKPAEPQPAPGPQKVHIWIQGQPNFKADLHVEIPEAARKLLGIGG